MLKFYVITVILCLTIGRITGLSAKAKAKREGYVKKEIKRSVFENIHAMIPSFVPIFNILLMGVYIFMFDELYKKLIKECYNPK